MIHPGRTAVKRWLFIQLFPYASYLLRIKTNTTRMPALLALIISCILGCWGCRRWEEHDSHVCGQAQRWMFACWSRGLEQARVNVQIQSLPRVLHNTPMFWGFFGLNILSLQILFVIKGHIVGVCCFGVRWGVCFPLVEAHASVAFEHGFSALPLCCILALSCSPHEPSLSIQSC